MAVERQNPLPKGVYWVDVFADKQPAFRAWLKRHRGKVKVVKAVSYKPTGSYPARDWLLFEVTRPVPWEGPGFPTVSERGVDLEADETAERPHVENPADVWYESTKDWLDTGPRLVGLVAMGVSIGAGIILLRKVNKS